MNLPSREGVPDESPLKVEGISEESPLEGGRE